MLQLLQMVIGVARAYFLSCLTATGQIVRGKKSSKCNIEEEFERRAPTESFARSVIEKGQDSGKGSRRNAAEIAALGEEEAKNTIGIFIAASLPGLVRFSEEDGSIKKSFKLVELSKFRAIVQRERKNRHTIQSSKNCIASIGSGSCADRKATDIAGFTIDQRDSGALASASDNRIALPVPDSEPVTDFYRPVRNNAVRMNGVEVRIFAFSALAAAAKMYLSLNAGEQATLDVPVDRLRLLLVCLCGSFILTHGALNVLFFFPLLHL